MKKPILVVMAAGIGSRFGGLKQMTPFGLHGESIIDYSLFDALRAGFERVVFIINSKIKDDFRERIGKHVEGRMEVQYVCQELDKIPAGYVVPKERIKPWGTSHALLCCKDVVDAPFCAINGDDLYGRHAFAEIFTFLNTPRKEGEYAMVGFEVSKTLSENGYVSRGECQVNQDGFLQSVVERIHIIPSMDGPLYTLDGNNYVRLAPETTVSMNIWGFTPGFLNYLEEGFSNFYREAMAVNPLKGEYLLPNSVGEMIRKEKASVKVLTSPDRWYGVTNASDRPVVENAIKEMTLQGIYPDGLWK